MIRGCSETSVRAYTYSLRSGVKPPHTTCSDSRSSSSQLASGFHAPSISVGGGAGTLLVPAAALPSLPVPLLPCRECTSCRDRFCNTTRTCPTLSSSRSLWYNRPSSVASTKQPSPRRNETTTVSTAMRTRVPWQPSGCGPPATEGATVAASPVTATGSPCSSCDRSPASRSALAAMLVWDATICSHIHARTASPSCASSRSPSDTASPPTPPAGSAPHAKLSDTGR
mmetsp:Transcript_1344/g.3652  ORF Transcript_1344/g.3652 Transcript_1344/m.3652 type:complete len:227 (+) Transcript_1344:124-804(+)